MAHFIAQRRHQAFLFHYLVDQRLTARHSINRCIRIGERILQAAINRAQQSMQRRRVVIHQAPRDDDGIGIKIHAVVAIIDETKILIRIYPNQLCRKADGIHKAEYAIHLAALQHLLPQIGLHVGDLHFCRINAGHACKGGEQLQRAIIGRAAQGSAFQILRRADRTIGLHRNGEGWAIEGGRNCHRRRATCRAARHKLDQRIDVAKTKIIGTGSHHPHRGARAIALIYGDGKAGLAEITPVIRQKEPALGALIAPIQHHFEPEQGLGDSGACQQGKRASAQHQAATGGGKRHGNLIRTGPEGPLDLGLGHRPW